MLEIDINLVPCGQQSKKRTIAKLNIGNVGGSRGFCDYIWTYHEPNPIDGHGSINAFGKIMNYDRQAPVYKLIGAILEDVNIEVEHGPTPLELDTKQTKIVELMQNLNKI